ncbi:MAG: DCC1-like thiol-disulfide oxidoreductase family protein [Planctomycetota bacterium]|nr:DCC1-like thiol-disulfide oxidoreductase family protein [Planctomycetota bacterium]
MTQARPLLLFDGTCSLCCATLQWVIRRDKKCLFDFAALQSGAAERALENVNFNALRPDSLILIADGQAHVFSTAAIETTRTLGFPWSLATLAFVIPVSIRDGVYRWIAARRHRLFKGPPACSLRQPDLRKRFLDSGEARGIVEAGPKH